MCVVDAWQNPAVGDGSSRRNDGSRGWLQRRRQVSAIVRRGWRGGKRGTAYRRSGRAWLRLKPRNDMPISADH